DPLQRDAALDETLLEQRADGLGPILADGADRDDQVVLLDRGVRVLEVEPGGELALGLVDRVAHLLAIDLGDDVEAGHVEIVPGGRSGLPGGTLTDRPARWAMGRCPSGQREQTVNL